MTTLLPRRQPGCRTLYRAPLYHSPWPSYGANRLSRINRKKISEAACFLHDVPLTSDIDLRDSKLKVPYKHENDEKRICGKRSNVKRNVDTEVVHPRIQLARSWQPVRRIPATSNFVYEFNPFDNVQSSNSSEGLRKSQDFQNLGGSINCSKGISISKSITNVKKDVKNIKARSVALPKLNSNTDTVNAFERQEKPMYLEGETTLPVIRKVEERTKNEVIVKEPENKCKTKPTKLSVIDQDIEKMKTNWQRYRKTHASNTPSGKLYDVLERATREIERIEKSIDLTGNRYLRNSATKLSKDSENIADRVVERVRKPTRFFTKGDCYANFKTNNTTSTNFPNGDDEKEIDKEKKEMFEIIDLQSNILLSRRDKSKRRNQMIAKTSAFNKEKSSEVKSEIVERYLNDYSANENKFDTTERNKAQKHLNFETSTEINTLTSLKGNTPEFQEAIVKNNEDDLKYTNCKNDNEITQNLKENEEVVSVKSSGKNEYIEACFNELNISKDVLGQVLQSEYLRKNLLSLHST